MPSDLAAVELLFTSLLVQAQTALMRAPGSSRSYRSSFLFAYAARIGERLPRDQRRGDERGKARTR